MSIPVLPKKRGRPATGRDPLLTVRAPQELIERVEAHAESQLLNKSDAVRTLLEAGLYTLEADDA